MAAELTLVQVFRLFLAVAILCGHGLCMAQTQGSFAKELDRIIRAGKERYRPIRTFRVEIRPGPNYWYEIEGGLPGAEYCRVYEHPRIECVCQWTPSVQKYESLVQQVTEALGDRWTSAPAKDKNGRRTMRFQAVQGGRMPSVEVTESGSSVRIAVVTVPAE